MTDIPQDLVEKVARRLAERHGYDPDGRADDFGLAFKGFAQGNLPCWHYFQNDARAAIQTLIDEGWKGPEDGDRAALVRAWEAGRAGFPGVE